mmetsp:Transcript_19232/g.22256  ORF Transcript_19232/g.22256 Transcript_19232/m.22256 type:complete len:209 (-) Transcript_19232:21-647(-)
MYGFFIDFDNNGRADFVVVIEEPTGKSSLVSYYNNFARDSYYISAAIYTSYSNAFGSQVYGASARGIYTTLSDKKYAFVANQITRTSFCNLQPPVAEYVIGRSNNYIEDFTVTYHNQEYNEFGEKIRLNVEQAAWSPIIPNSNLLIEINEPSSIDWTIQLLINPTDSFLLVGIILSLILILIGGIIIYIHLKEKKEDEESRNPQLDFF